MPRAKKTFARRLCRSLGKKKRTKKKKKAKRKKAKRKKAKKKKAKKKKAKKKKAKKKEEEEEEEEGNEEEEEEEGRQAVVLLGQVVVSLALTLSALTRRFSAELRRVGTKRDDWRYSSAHGSIILTLSS